METNREVQLVPSSWYSQAIWTLRVCEPISNLCDSNPCQIQRRPNCDRETSIRPRFCHDEANDPFRDVPKIAKY